MRNPNVTPKRTFTTRTLAYCALLAALSVVLARFIVPMPNASTRFSIEAVPIFISGMLFGPMAGGLVGFSADLVGCLFSGYGYNPLFCIPPILYGVAAGLFRRFLGEKLNLFKLFIAFLVPVVLGSVFYQSAALAFVYNSKGSFATSFVYFLSTRSIQFAITMVLDVLIIFFLFRTGMFHKLGVWPPKMGKKLSHKKGEITMNVNEAIEYIHSVCWKGSIPGLERTQELLQKMGNPEKSLKFVHIAGTNGKGSTAAMTASILRKAGYRTGLYTSPYIYRFHERMQIDGVEISDQDLVEVTEYVKPFADSMEQSPTEFELVCAIAFEYFKRKDCDIVVLEVGMGGEMDATNVIETPEAAVITNIGLDHTEVLGDTLEKIAETKGGIIKPNGHAVIYRGKASVEAVFERICAERNNTLKKADFEHLIGKSSSLDGQIFDCGDRKDLFLPLLGEHQLHNAAVVLAVADTLIESGWKISEENIREGLRDVKWPGRFDIVSRDPLFIIDGGHNPQCIEALAKNIAEYLQDRRVIALTGVLADKDYADMYRPIMPMIEQFVCVTPPNPRRLTAEKLAEYLMAVGAKATPSASVEDGVKKAIELCGDDGVVLCFGSLYSIGSIRDALLKIQAE